MAARGFAGGALDSSGRGVCPGAHPPNRYSTPHHSQAQLYPRGHSYQDPGCVRTQGGLTLTLTPPSLSSQRCTTDPVAFMGRMREGSQSYYRNEAFSVIFKNIVILADNCKKLQNYRKVQDLWKQTNGLKNELQILAYSVQ
jgi:hypothetical protein